MYTLIVFRRWVYKSEGPWMQIQVGAAKSVWLTILSLLITTWSGISPLWIVCLKQQQIWGIGSWITMAPFNLQSGFFWPSNFYGCGWQLLVSSKVHDMKKVLNKCVLNEEINRWVKKCPRPCHHKQMGEKGSIYTHIFYLIEFPKQPEMVSFIEPETEMYSC